MSDKIIEAYDNALIELLWLQAQIENSLNTLRNALIQARNVLIQARREALQKELKKT